MDTCPGPGVAHCWVQGSSGSQIEMGSKVYYCPGLGLLAIVTPERAERVKRSITATFGLMAAVGAAMALGYSPSAFQNPLFRRRVAFTTPPTYAVRLTRLLELHGAVPLHLPTVVVGPNPWTLAEIRPYLATEALDPFSAIAFTSRTGIAAFSLALPDADAPRPLSDSGDTFTVAALGKDVELLHEEGLLSRLCSNPSRIRILVPEIASPEGLVESLGAGSGGRIICPVPAVVDLEEPLVVPDFLRALAARGWVPEKVCAYETRWEGPRCMEGLVGLDAAVDAIVFTSSAEVEGLMKGLEALGWSWGKVRRRWPKLLVCAHGPVTAKGVEKFGIRVDVVSSKFGSFDGVLEALASKLKALSEQT